MEALNRMLEQHNKLGGAKLTVNPSSQGQNMVDIHRNGRVLVSALTYEKAIYTISVLESAKKQEIEEKIAELESLCEAIHNNDDCLYGENVEIEIAALKALLND